MGFKVGDKVVMRKSRAIGTVVKITPKRKNVVVDFGRYKVNFSLNGWKKGADVWSSDKIELLTPEIEQEIQDETDINRCYNLVRTSFTLRKLTANQARQILQILGEGERDE